MMAQKKKPTSKKVEEAWNEEIARRIRDLDTGKVKTIPWEDVCRRIKSKLVAR